MNTLGLRVHANVFIGGESEMDIQTDNFNMTTSCQTLEMKIDEVLSMEIIDED